MGDVVVLRFFIGRGLHRLRLETFFRGQPLGKLRTDGAWSVGQKGDFR
jgi:hypothetical protein